MKKFYTEGINEVLIELGVNPETGLNESQVEKSRERFGANSFGESEKVSLGRRIWEATTEPMLIMLIVAWFITLAVKIGEAVQNHTAPDLIECVGILFAIALSVVITVITEGKSNKAFEELNKINEDTLVKVIRNGKADYVPQRDIVVGDILLVETGDKLVADGRLIESFELNIDESSLTGESVPVVKDENFEASDDTPVADCKNMVFSGCFVTGGNGKLVVTAVGKSSEFGKIAGELATVKDKSTPLQEKLARLSKLIAVLGCSAAAIVLVAQIIKLVIENNVAFDTVANACITSIVLIVAAVPEGLPTIVAVSLALNIVKMSHENALVKKMVACETIGCVNIICSDKTGTLTENKMTVIEGYFESKLLEPDQIKDQWVINNFCINSNANITLEDNNYSFVGNPTECALLVSATKSGFDYNDIRKNAKVVELYAFSSQKKYMTTVADVDGKTVAFMKGSPGKIMNRCKDLSDERKEELKKMIAGFQEQAGRLIAFSHKEIAEWNDDAKETIDEGFTFDGFVVIKDPISEDVYPALAKCTKAGIQVKMLTGDNLVTATAIANDLNLLDNGGIAVTGSEVDAMTDDELLAKLPSIRVIARSTPMIKMRVVKLLKSVGNVVAVTGDGINDAPAIKHADVGISMGVAGTEVTKEASDIVLLDDSFKTIVKAVQWGRGIYENFKRFILFQLTVNISAVIVIIGSMIAGFEVPFTALDLLWINIIMDGPPALTLGLEPIRDHLFDNPPTKRNENIISKVMLFRILANGLFISVIFMIQLYTNFIGAPAGKGDALSGEEKTVLFTLFVLFQLFNAFNCREIDSEPMYKNLFKNKLMLLVFVIVFGLQWLITQFGHAVFKTSPLSLTIWIKMLFVALSIVVVNEIVKIIYRLCKHK